MSNIKRRTISDQFETEHTYREASGVCPHCSTFSTFNSKGSLDAPPGHHDPKSKRTNYVRIELAFCPGCKGIVLGAIEFSDPQRSNVYQARHLWPVPIWPDQAPDDLEPEIRKYYDESREILTRSPAGSAVLSRRCLQHVIEKRLEIEEDSLFKEITEAVKRPELTKSTKDALHHVREIGNWSAHPSMDQASILIDVTREEAEYTLETLEMVFRDVFESPSRVALMEKRISEKKECGGAAS